MVVLATISLERSCQLQNNSSLVLQHQPLQKMMKQQVGFLHHPKIVTQV
jgi:hypothetical protein